SCHRRALGDEFSVSGTVLVLYWPTAVLRRTCHGDRTSRLRGLRPWVRLLGSSLRGQLRRWHFRNLRLCLSRVPSSIATGVMDLPTANASQPEIPRQPHSVAATSTECRYHDVICRQIRQREFDSRCHRGGQSVGTEKAGIPSQAHRKAPALGSTTQVTVGRSGRADLGDATISPRARLSESPGARCR